MAQNADLKRYKILEAAKKRFSHFGLSKTTMAEIAQDLSFSKALLYYYYPDKNSLFTAVLEQALEDFNVRMNQLVDQGGNVTDLMLDLLQARIESIQEHYTLFEIGYNFRREIPPELDYVIKNSYDIEMKLLSRVLELGIKNNEIKVDDVDETSRLLLFSLYGMRFGVLKDLNWIVFPRKDEFQQILDMQQKMVLIFIEGLKIR